MGATVNLVTFWQTFSEYKGIGKSGPARSNVNRASSLLRVSNCSDLDTWCIHHISYRKVETR